MPYQPYRIVYRTRNTKTLPITGVSIYPLSIPDGLQRMPAVVAQNQAYGMFWSNTTQGMVDASTPKAITYGFASPLLNLSYTGSAIRVGLAGVYLINFSVQGFRLIGGTATAMDVWFRINGVNVADSASQTIIPSGAANNETIITVSLMARMLYGDTFEVVFATPDWQHTQATAFTAITTPYIRPGIPSIITVVTRVGD